MSNLESFLFTVTDVKQFQYCARIIYFTYVQPVPRRLTYLMERGKESHLEEEKLEPRRVLKKYGLEDGERVFKEYLSSDKLHLKGRLDLYLKTSGRFYPVEFKFTEEKAPRYNYLGQIAAYALLLEERYCTNVDKGFFYHIPLKKTMPVIITGEDKMKVLKSIEGMKNLILNESFPPATKNRGKCIDCEWRNFCGDIPVSKRHDPVIGRFNKEKA